MRSIPFSALPMVAPAQADRGGLLSARERFYFHNVRLWAVPPANDNTHTNQDKPAVLL